MSLLFPHRLNLPAALSGRRCDIRSEVGRLSYYAAAPDAGAPPLLLLHSVNAAGSAYEVRPLYEHYRRTRAVYAFDLPGFGFSERGDRSYTPRLMTNAVSAMVAEIQSIHGKSPIDALALSLAAEFLARCALEKPLAFRSLGLISPTGFSRTTPDHAPPDETRAMPRLRKVLNFAGRFAFDLLTTKPSIRHFLNKTWGSKAIDEGLLEYDYLTTHQPGAQYAPFAFVSGYLFSRNIQATYRALTVPVWMAHGVRGDFTDYSKAPDFALRSNWTVRSFPTGALPHFESLDAVVQSYDRFLDQLPQRGAT
jgi:pimeloyl-ACP methyl ester carboxylesterase